MKKILATLMKIILAKHFEAHAALEQAKPSAPGGQGMNLSQIAQNPIPRQAFAAFGGGASLTDALYAGTRPAMIAARGAPDRAIPGWRDTGGGTVNRVYSPLGHVDQMLSGSDEPGGHITVVGKGDQEALRALLFEVDAVVVVGGKNSNNTLQLLSTCRKTGTPSFHIERVEELAPGWFKGFETVGVTAGTSTLRETVEAVGAWLKRL